MAVAGVVLAATLQPSAVAAQPAIASAPSLAAEATWSKQELASATDTRRRLGFPSQAAYVAQLQGSQADVGTAEIGLPLTSVELAEVERREAVYGLFHERLEAEVRARPDYGGIYVDQPAGGKIVVLTTGDPEGLAAQLRATEPRLYHDLVTRRVEFSAAQLESATRLLMRDQGVWFHGVPLFSAMMHFERRAGGGSHRAIGRGRVGAARWLGYPHRVECGAVSVCTGCAGHRRGSADCRRRC